VGSVGLLLNKRKAQKKLVNSWVKEWRDDEVVGSGVETRAIAASETEIKIKAQKRYCKNKDGEE
jgi:hypothetical protein